MGQIRVTALATTPVKGLRIASRTRLQLEAGGIRDDRVLYLIDERGRMINGKVSGELNQVTAVLAERRLTLRFPDGSEVSGELQEGELVQSAIHSRARSARVLLGPFAAALSEHCGRRLRLVRAADGSSAIDRGVGGAVSLISRASLAYLARSAGDSGADSEAGSDGEAGRDSEAGSDGEAGRDSEADSDEEAGGDWGALGDGRRFRMSIEVDGTEPFEEDRWIGRELSIGTARVVPGGHVGRCIVTSRHPETGEIDVATLDVLRAIRAGALTTEPLAIGVYGTVSRAGIVALGDALELH